MPGDFWGFVETLPLGDISFFGLLALAIWAILTGRLVPRRILDDVRLDRDTRVAEKAAETAEWKEAYHLQYSVTSQLVDQNEKMLGSQETMEHLLRSIQERGKQ